MLWTRLSHIGIVSKGVEIIRHHLSAHLRAAWNALPHRRAASWQRLPDLAPTSLEARPWGLRRRRPCALEPVPGPRRWDLTAGQRTDSLGVLKALSILCQRRNLATVTTLKLLSSKHRLID